MTKSKSTPGILPGAMLAAEGVPVSEMVAAATRLQGKMADAALRQNIETLDFLKARFEKDRELLTELAQSKEPSAAMSIWSEFWQGAMADYSSETGKLFAMMAAITDEAMKTATEEGRRIVETAQTTAGGGSTEKK